MTEPIQDKIFVTKSSARRRSAAIVSKETLAPISFLPAQTIYGIVRQRLAGYPTAFRIRRAPRRADSTNSVYLDLERLAPRGVRLLVHGCLRWPPHD